MKTRIFKNIFIIFLFTGTLQAERLIPSNQYIFKQIGIEDGLSQSSVNSIIQDQKGFMWFATANGLNKYDGHSIKGYYNKLNDSTSVSDNGISSLFVDRDGYLWIGTVNGKLNRYNRMKDSFERFTITDKRESALPYEPGYFDYPIVFSRHSENSITSISQDSNGYLWIGTWGKGLYRLQPSTGEIIRYLKSQNNSDFVQSNRITEVLVDSDGILWIATFGGGLHRAFIANGAVIAVSVFCSDSDKTSSLADDEIITVYEDSRKNIWIGTYHSGLSKISSDQKFLESEKIRIESFRRQENTSNCLCNNTVMAIEEDRKGFLWIGTFGGGLDRFDQDSISFDHFFNNPADENSLADNDVISLFEDNSGIIWVGTHLGAGVSKIIPATNRFNRLVSEPGNTNSLNDNIVWAILQDSDSVLWIGTYKGGLNKFDRKSGNWTHYLYSSANPFSIPDNHIRALAEDQNGYIWIGTYNQGLGKFDKHTGKTIRIKNIPGNPGSLAANQIQDIYCDSGNVLWIGTFGGGLSIANADDITRTGKFSFTNYKHDPDNPESLSDNRVYDIYKDSKGNYWIATFGGGLNRFYPETGIFKSYRSDPSPQSLSDDRVLTVFEDSQGNLWIGTFGGSLNKFNINNETFQHFGIPEGLTSSTVYGILEDNDQNLWMSTDDGIFRFSLKDSAFTQFDLSDGLQSMEFSGGAYFESYSGEMFFGGIRGINYFFPDSIKQNSFTPPVVITSVRVLNSEIKGERESLELSYDRNFITIEFAVLDYINPAGNRYRYILEGLDNDWHESKPESRIANYIDLPPGTYLFKVNGSNSDGVWNEEFASLKITIMPPFWATWWFILLVIIAAGTGIYYLSTIRIKNLLAIERLKTKLAADLHDNIGSGLTEISILSELASRKTDQYRQAAAELKTISETARKLVDSMSDIVWVVNPRRDSLYDLIVRLKDSYKDLLFSLGISFRTSDLQKIKNIRLPMEYKQNLNLIFKEAINNAVKHSSCKKIILAVNIRKDVLEISLSDDGKGFDPGTGRKGNGLRNIENRAKQIGGRIKLKSSKNEGTTIRFIGRIKGISRLLNYLYSEGKQKN